MIRKIKLVKVIWTENNLIKEAAGFLISENNQSISIASTIGIKGFLDKIKISKNKIISQKYLTKK